MVLLTIPLNKLPWHRPVSQEIDEENSDLNTRSNKPSLKDNIQEKSSSEKPKLPVKESVNHEKIIYARKSSPKENPPQNNNQCQQKTIPKVKVKEFSCDYCEKSYSTAKILHRHKKSHEGGKNIVCHVCQMAFFRKDELKSHSYKHKTEKSINCEECNTKFKTKKSFKRHLTAKTCSNKE